MNNLQVFGCEGHTTIEVVLVALKDAINQRMHITILPEIKYVDNKKVELEATIKQGSNADIILIAAIRQENRYL